MHTGTNEAVPKVAILIPTIVGREAYLDRLLNILKPQCEGWAATPDAIYFKDGVILIDKDNREATIGEKRNRLERKARSFGATHRAFIDDDDTVSEDYISLNMPGVYGMYDCNSLVGIYSVNGVINPKKHVFLHSLKYTHWYEDDTYYYRNPNHLNWVRLDRIEGIKFQEKNFGEDGCWSEDVAKAGVLKNEYEITKPFYNYEFRSKSNGI